MCGNLLMNAERQLRQLVIDGRCTICHTGREDVSHVLRGRLLAHSVWIKEDIIVASKLYVHELIEASPRTTLRADSSDVIQGAASGWRLPRQGWVKLNVDGTVVLSHVRWEVNTVADKLATIMHGQPPGAILFKALPYVVRNVVITEELVASNFHEDPGG
ncbi:hypothetical protein V6N13_034667 [Hibiscus sabdariffa]